MKTPGNNKKGAKKNDLPGYPAHPESEDIYNNEDKVANIDDDENPRVTSSKRKQKLNEKDYTNDKIGDDLDVPGAELDDDLEDIGEEDEENNYYSLGGDDHEDLDETNADLELDLPEDDEED